MYQDVATVEVEKDRFNRVQVQVVGDVFMYGNNFIYEPVYAFRPVIYNSFWIRNYRPYCSMWNWGLYPSYFSFWRPFPVFVYHNNLNLYINNFHQYNYVNFRRCEVAYNSYRGRRGNAYEHLHPTRSFNYRNQRYANRYELDNSRITRTIASTRNQTVATTSNNNVVRTRNNPNQRTDVYTDASPRNYTSNNVRTKPNESNEIQNYVSSGSYSNGNVRTKPNQRIEGQNYETPRNNNTSYISFRNYSNSKDENRSKVNNRNDNYQSASPSRSSRSNQYSEQMKSNRNSGKSPGNRRG